MLLNFLELLHGQEDSGQVGVIKVALADLKVVEGALHLVPVPADALRQDHCTTLGGLGGIIVGFFADFLEDLVE